MAKQGSHKLIKKGMTIALSLLLSFASIGFTYSIHYCHGNQAGISYYSGLYKMGNACSCDAPFGHLQPTTSSPDHTQISKWACCKNVKVFQKIHTVSFQQIQKVFLTPIAFPVSTVEILNNCNTGQVLENIFQWDTGRGPIQTESLVLLFHQIRIPLPSGDC